MKKVLIISFSSLLLVGYGFTNKKNVNKIKWYSWEQAVIANKTTKKKMFIDVYTKWCGWCKVMDRETFENDSIANYLNANFYPIKLDAEQKDSILFGNNKFIYVSPEEGGGRNGVHSLAYSLLDGKMSYPTVVYLTEEFERIMISPGYKQVPQLYKELIYTSEEKYKSIEWKDYQK
jgi:thioredoxin-related protein